MRCSKCGSFIDNHENVCPVCGTVVDVVEKSEVIQAEIGNKIDMFLNDRDDNLKNGSDGVDMQNGQMDVSKASRVSDTIKFKDAENESVFKTVTVTAGKQQPDQEMDDLAEEIRQDLEPEEIILDEYEEKKTISPGALAAIIIGGVVVIAIIVLLVSGTFERIFSGGGESTSQQTEAETETETEVRDTIMASLEDGGSYTAPLEITLSSTLNGAVYYTLDGTTPSKYSQRYTGPVKISDNDIKDEEDEFVLRAISLNASGVQTGEMEIRFTVTLSEIEAPVFSLESGDYSSAQSISITAQSGTTIYYTYDGSEPTTDSAEYSGPITMKRGNNVLSAIAVENGRVSEVAQAVYDLDIPSAISYEKAELALSAYMVECGYLPESEIPEKAEPQTEAISDESEESGESAAAETTEEPKEPETVNDNKYFSILNAGMTVIGNSQYYVFEVDAVNADREPIESAFYGVDDQDASIVRLEKDGYSYYISE